MKEGSSGGASLCEGFHEGDFRGGLLYWGTQKMRFLGDMQNALQTDLSLHRGPVGEPGGGPFAGTFERKEKYTWVHFLDKEVIKILSLGHTYLGSFFLDPEDIRKLNIGAVWNFGRNRALLI
jgi:hypothetical protein